MTALLVCLAGSVGAMARFVLDAAIRARLRAGFPWATLIVNLTGSALLGTLAGLTAAGTASPAVALVLGTGFCGGYTTFSTATVETLTLLRTARRGAAAAYGLGTLLGCVAAAWAGLAATL